MAASGHDRQIPIDKGTGDATLRAVTVHDAPIWLSESDPAWPTLFDRESRRIHAALGNRVLRLEHVGSTSVPGLPAKPIIDMGVADSANENSYVSSLQELGYLLRIREPDWHEHRLLNGPDTAVNLHVFTEGDAEIQRMIAFRDHLRTGAGDRGKYAKVKRQLARRRWKYVQDYADAKSTIVNEILKHVQPD